MPVKIKISYSDPEDLERLKYIIDSLKDKENVEIKHKPGRPYHRLYISIENVREI